MDKFGSYLSRRRNTHPQTRNTTYYTALHRRRTRTRTRDSISQRQRRRRNNPRKSRHQTLRLGTFSRPKPHRSTYEVFRRHLFRLQVISMLTRDYSTRPALHTTRTPPRRKQNQQSSQLGTLQRSYGCTRVYWHHWCL